MNVQPTRENAPEDGDSQKSERPIANVGKRFYTWATLGTFAGACFLVSGVWALLTRLTDNFFTSEAWPLLFTVVVVVAFAFATEPEQKTSRNQKFQKGLVTIGNVLLVYFSVIGASTVVTQIIATGTP